MKITDIEQLSTEWVDRLSEVKISFEGTSVVIDCVDDHQAHDIGYSVALVLADKVAGWRRVIEGLPSKDEVYDRMMGRLSATAAERDAK